MKLATHIAILCLAAVCLLNLLMNLRLARLVTGSVQPPFTAPIGEVAPVVEGRTLRDGRKVSSSEFAAQSTVLLFLRTGCPHCTEVAREISRMAPRIDQAGVVLWIIVIDRQGPASALLGKGDILNRVLELTLADCRKLNPSDASPFYVFIDDERRVRASHFVGDANWESFVNQISEPD